MESILKKIAAAFVIAAVAAIAGPAVGFSAETATSVPEVFALLGRPTDTSVTVNLAVGLQPVICHVRYRKEGDVAWRNCPEMRLDGYSSGETVLSMLSPGGSYRYEVMARLEKDSRFQPVVSQSFRTRVAQSSGFSFAIFSDAHITHGQKERGVVLKGVCDSIRMRNPAFLAMLGDNIQTFTSHGGPMGEEGHGPYLYHLLRRAMSDLSGSTPVFAAVGNWEGENGWHSQRERSWARTVRKGYLCNPRPDTYPEGGSPEEDYYGFTWGDALFLVLNVTGYTASDHGMGSPVGRPNDWTLGEDQKKWLLGRLSGSMARWKFILIHHTVGGNAGDEVNSRYGRGGGRAAAVGEQATVHEWMKRYGVQALFYGHDHVFTDTVVDGIHYVCVGSAGAPWKFDRSITGYESYWTPSGYTWVAVDRNSVEISFIAPEAQYPEGKVLHTIKLAPSGRALDSPLEGG